MFCFLLNEISKISVNNKILTESLREEKRWCTKKLLDEFPSKGQSRSGIDSLLRRIDARESAARKVAWGLLLWTTLYIAAVVEMT